MFEDYDEFSDRISVKKDNIVDILRYKNSNYYWKLNKWSNKKNQKQLNCY